jgi:hypothetical protein
MALSRLFFALNAAPVDRELSVALADLKQKRAECLAAETRAKLLQERKTSMVEHLRMVIHDGETRRAGASISRCICLFFAAT